MLLIEILGLARILMFPSTDISGNIKILRKTKLFALGPVIKGTLLTSLSLMQEITAITLASHSELESAE